jgi:dynein light intermediate chain 1
MIGWRDRGRGGNALDGGGSSNTAEGDISLPLGPGEWEEALGLPLCVVCQNVLALHPTTETLLIVSIGRPN